MEHFFLYIIFPLNGTIIKKKARYDEQIKVCVATRLLPFRTNGTIITKKARYDEQTKAFGGTGPTLFRTN